MSSLNRNDALPRPPETASACSTKCQDSEGVVALIETLIGEIDNELTESETEGRLVTSVWELAFC